MAYVRLTRVVSFCSAHRYYRPDWSPERNAETFGSCANEHGHGHTYECHVTIVGPLDDATGMVMHLGKLDGVLQQEILERFDHRHINYDVPEFAYGRQIPTSEALAVYIWHRVAPRLPSPIRLECVRVEEDRQLYAEYDGSGDAPVRGARELAG